MSEQITDEDKARKKNPGGISLSRRRLLKVLTLLGASWLVPSVTHQVHHPEGLASISYADQRLVDSYLSLATGQVFDLELITTEVPPQLQGVDIPISNEYFQEPDEVFRKGLALYERWRQKDSSLPSLVYLRPSNYVSIPSFIAKLNARLTTKPLNGSSIADKLEQLKFEALWVFNGQIDVRNSKFISGSTSNITSLDTLVGLDPGTGLVRIVQDHMAEKYGNTFDIYDACSLGLLTDEQRKEAMAKFNSWYSGALKYVNKIREKSKTPISTSYLFAYFLFVNKGNILASTWDTMTWLKVSARNNLEEALRFEPSYDKAKLICGLFRDEFSEKISANWVVEHVAEDDAYLNDVSDPYIYPEWKDYMPINRAGFYHAWNIMALLLCMEVPLARRVVAEFLNPLLEDDGKQRLTEYGKERCVADMRVVDKGASIRALAEVYS